MLQPGGGGVEMHVWRSMPVKASVEKKCFQNCAGTFPLLYKVIVFPLPCYTKCKIKALY